MKVNITFYFPYFLGINLNATSVSVLLPKDKTAIHDHNLIYLAFGYFLWVEVDVLFGEQLVSDFC